MELLRALCSTSARAFRLGSLEAATVDVLATGSEAEVLEPPALRERVAAEVVAMAATYGVVVRTEH